MIEIVLVRGYSKNDLDYLLRKIKNVAPRELTYGLKARDIVVDVNIEDKNSLIYAVDYDRISSNYPDDIWIVVGQSSYEAYYQGERYKGESLDELIYDMLE